MIVPLLALCQGGLARADAQWVPPIQKVPHAFIQTEVIGVRGGVTRRLGTGTIEAGPGRPGALSLPLDLGPASGDHPVAIEIEVVLNSVDEPKVGLTVVTTIAIANRAGDVTRIRRERVAQVDEGRSFLHQAYENATLGTSVLLTMTPESRIVPQLVKPTVSAPVIFNVTLSRVTPQGDVPLEDNVLRTFEASPVSYAFRIAAAASAPIEVASAESGSDASGALGASGANTEAIGGAAPAEGAPQTSGESAPATEPPSGKKAKPKKLSKKEREREALAQFQRARAAQEAAAAASGSTATSAPGASDPATSAPGAAPAPDAAASEPSSAGASPRAASPPSPENGEPQVPTPAPSLAAEELELTLLPRRVESGILMVEASLRGRAPGHAGAERAVLVQRTHAITSKGTFDITVSGIGPAGSSYRFTIQARF